MKRKSIDPVLRKKFPWRYFILTFILSAIFWMVGEVFPLWLPEMPANLPFSSLMVLTPTVAAVICTNRENGRGSAIRLLTRAFDFNKIHPKDWYLPILLLMPSVMVIQIVILRMMSQLPSSFQISWLTLLTSTALFYLAALAEELGWQGYVIIRLRQRWNLLASGIFLGIVWAVWHIIPFIQMQQSLTWILWQCLNLSMTRLIIVWVSSRTKYSISSAALFHTMYNVSTLLTPIYDPMIVTLVLIFIIGAFTVHNKLKDLMRKREERHV